MKKHLIAAAVAGALAVPAMAQVTVYGTLELGIESTDAATNTTKMDSHEFVSNRLGFKGEEDLGGGMKATFRLESTVGPSNGAKNTLFNRGAELGLSGGFGSVRLGKLDHAGIEGNDDLLLGNLNLGSSSVESGGLGQDVDGTVAYTTPAMGGFTFNVTHTLPDGGAAANSQSTAFTHDGITSYQAAGKVGALAVKLGGGERKELAGNKIKVMGTSVRYNLGMAAVSAFYQQQDNPAGTNDASQVQISVLVPLGGDLSVGGTYQKLDVDGGNASDSTTTAVMAKKALSKRTSLYGLYRIVDPKAAGTDSTKTLGFYVGHSF
jgi:predicted porin